MSCYQWDLKERCFRDANEPIDTSDSSDWTECIRRSGYAIEFNTQDDEFPGATVNVYRTTNEGKPQFFIDIGGQETGIATLVADDFPSLIATLQQLQPLISLVAVDHAAASRNFDRVERELDRRSKGR